MTDKLRILVVDDSKVVRKAFSRILSEDYDLVEAEDGEGAWLLLEEDNEICAVFTDINMPRLDGVGLTERIRASKDPEIRALPIVLVTAAGDGDENTKKALTAGANDYVLKPFDSVFLHSKVKSHVKHRDKEIADSNLASLDPLTRLANKTYFLERGEQEVSAANRHKTELALLLVTIDDFQVLTEAAGNDIVKGIIRKLGSYMSSEVRLEDTVARIERERFAIILSETPAKAAIEMAERLRDKIQQKVIRHKERSYKVTVSVGVSALPPQVNRTLDMMMMEADRRLSEAVKNGGNRTVPAVPKEDKQAAESLVLSLDEALSRLRRRDYKMSEAQAQASFRILLPLLESCNKQLVLDLDEKIEVLKAKFSDPN